MVSPWLARQGHISSSIPIHKRCKHKLPFFSLQIFATGHSSQCICKKRSPESDDYYFSRITGARFVSSHLFYVHTILVLMTTSTLQLGLVLGLILCFVVAIILQLSSQFFTNDANVLRLLQLGIPVATISLRSYKFHFNSYIYLIISITRRISLWH